MSASFNKVILAGNLTRKPEVRPVGSDKSVTSFGIAVNERYKKDGEVKESVTFIDCEAWNKTGELVAQYLDKGSSVFLEGKLKLDQWEDKDGQKRSKLKVVVENVQFLGGKRDSVVGYGVGGNDAEPAQPPAPRKPSGGGDDLEQPPF